MVRQTSTSSEHLKGGKVLASRAGPSRAGIGAHGESCPDRAFHPDGDMEVLPIGRVDARLFSRASRHAGAMQDNHASQDGSQNLHDLIVRLEELAASE